jgi:hypothetical protein
VLVENEEVSYVRSNRDSVINIPFHNFSFNPTNCRPVVKDFTPNESISLGVLLLDLKDRLIRRCLRVQLLTLHALPNLEAVVASHVGL